MADTKISELTPASTPVAGTELVPVVQGGATKRVSIENVTAGRSVNVKYLAANTTLKTWYANSVPVQFGNGGVLEARDNYAPLSAWAANAYVDASGNDKYIDSGEATRLEQSGGLFRWKTAPSGSADTTCSFTNRMELANATGDLSLKTGNLVIGTSGKGVDFSADGNASGMTSELLDDYEEGTWTATLTPTTGSITLYSGFWDGGYYTKVGRLVHCVGFIRAESVSSPTGSLTLGGLPFTAVSGTNGRTAVCIDPATGWSLPATASIIGRVNEGTTTVGLEKFTTTASDLAADIGANVGFNVSITYFTA